MYIKGFTNHNIKENKLHPYKTKILFKEPPTSNELFLEEVQLKKIIPHVESHRPSIKRKVMQTKAQKTFFSTPTTSRIRFTKTI